MAGALPSPLTARGSPKMSGDRTCSASPRRGSGAAAPSTARQTQRSPFGASALRIGRAVHEVNKRVERLSRLANKRSLFDDPAAEIGQMSAVLKQEMSTIGASIAALARAPRGGGGRQWAAHAEAVLAWLGQGLNTGSEAFQAALKQREAIQSAKETRAEKLSGVAAGVAAPSTPAAGPRGGSSLLYRGHRRPAPPSAAATAWAHHDINASGMAAPPTCSAAYSPGLATPGGAGMAGAHGDTVIDMSGMMTPQPPGSGDSYAQQQAWMPRSRKHREQEVTAMQSTLADIGQMFSRFSAIVAEQGELIERIDANTEASVNNVEEAHNQILKYSKYVQGNRGLIVKTFAVLAFFIVLFSSLR